MTINVRRADQVTKSSPDQSSVLSVVLPAYNEAENVRRLADELHDVLSSEALAEYRPTEIIFVDDGSTDGTRDVLETLAAEYEPVKTVFLNRNFGQSAAISAGVDYAGGEVIVTMDADGQNDPADIPRLLEKFAEGYDCVSGWRRTRKDPLAKRVPSAIQTYLAKLTGPDINDFGCTLKIYDADAIRDIDIYGEAHRYIPAKLYKRGYRIGELEVNHRAREYGSTKYGSKRLVKGFLDLLFNLFWNRFSTRPLHLFGGLGLLFSGVGGLIGLHAVAVRMFFGVSLSPRTPRLLLVVLSITFGVQLIVFGFLGEMIVRTHYRDKRPYRVRSIEE